MEMDKKCENCTEKCPQAELAHQASLGRMYASKELIVLLEKIESGELVEVVRCKDCQWYAPNNGGEWVGCQMFNAIRAVPEDAPGDNDFCSYGERRACA